MQSIKKLINLAQHKNQIDIKRDEAKYMNHEWLLQSIIDEVNEVREEIQTHNTAHLEDELSDILWSWMILVEKLKHKKYIESHEAIFERALKKYEERILPLQGNSNDHLIWKAVKTKQKEELKAEKNQRNRI